MIALLLTMAVVIYSPCPAYPELAGCYYPDTQVVYVSPKFHRSVVASIRGHELGHWFSHTRLTPEERISLMNNVFPRWRGEWREEDFAQFFASCFVSRWFLRTSFGTVPRKRPEVCHAITATL